MEVHNALIEKLTILKKLNINDNNSYINTWWAMALDVDAQKKESAGG